MCLGKDFPTLRLKASRDDILAQKEQNPDPQEALRYYQVQCTVYSTVQCIVAVL